MVLDIVDDVALRPFSVRRRSVRGVGVHDFDWEIAGIRYSVFIAIQVNHIRHEVSSPQT
jgi:hypothetical protein